MKMQEAADIISGKADRTGYVVSFEKRERGMLCGDHFPDVHAGEPGIATVLEALDLAAKFAARRRPDRDVVNVCVCSALDFTPACDNVMNRYPEEEEGGEASADEKGGGG